MASIAQPLAVSAPRHPRANRHYCRTSKLPLGRKSCAVRCCGRRSAEDKDGSTEKKIKGNYYQLLGVSVDSEPSEIKAAYRKLQKKYHPDIAGKEAHGYVLKLNEAYGVLMSENSRRVYDASIGQVRAEFVQNGSGLAYSAWNGPSRPEALFVDENACIGCRECVHHASKTFMMDEALGSARVNVQYGDDEEKIEVAVESCPVNCIHWVDREELPVLEFLIRPQPKDGHGVFGQGWERPANVFMAAKSFGKQLKRKAGHEEGEETGHGETPAQAEARVNASMKMRNERFSRIWDWLRKDSD